MDYRHHIEQTIIQDHFYLAGPKSDPANLTHSPSVLDAFNRIVTQGNADVALSVSHLRLWIYV